MKYSDILRWTISIIWCSITCKGSFYYTGAFSSDSGLLQSSNVAPVPLYSKWSEWTTCSATCGSGITTRTRTCLKSVKNDRGVYLPVCHGDYSEHKICNTQKCAETVAEPRLSQCSQYDNQVTAGRFIRKWIPSSGGPNPCELRCEATDETLVYSFGKVVDGTSCPLGMCLDGRCWPVGCDGRLGALTTVDMCGICGGRNSTCIHYKDIYQGQLPESESQGSYREVVVIPFEARKIIIRQPSCKNILALQDRSKGIIMSGEQSENKYGGRYEIAGTSFLFQKQPDNGEELSSDGPITQDLYVLILLRAYNPGVYYEYWLPKQSKNSVGQSYLPTWSQNSPTSIPSPKSYTIPPFQTSKQTTHHYPPPKPPFAFGYGEQQPSKNLDLPVFRRKLTTILPIHDKDNQLDNSLDSVSRFIKDKFVPPYYKRAPKLDYYKTYRNFDTANKSSVPLVVDSTRDLTQGDSAGLVNNGNSRYKNKAFEDAYKGKKKDLDGYNNLKIPVKKREEISYNVPNGKLKYSFKGDAKDSLSENASGMSPHLTINVLPDTSKRSTKKVEGVTPQTRLENDGRCEPCNRTRNQLQHFCDSDFVVRASVIGYDYIDGETRFELDVIQSFRNNLSLLAKEYVWARDTCRCPRLRPGKEYVIMGYTDNQYGKRESRLIVDRTSFVRTYNLKYARRLQKLRKDQDKKCRKT